MTDYDLLITNFFHQFSNSPIDFALTMVTNIIYVIGLYFLYYFFRKKQKRNLYLLIISGILGLGITTGSKYLINRPRPFPPSPFEFFEKSDPSFPSRHSFLAGLSLYFLPKEFSKKTKRIFQIYFLIIIPLSLLITGVHYITDIVAGLAIGYFLPWVLNKLLGNKTFIKRSE